MLGAARVSGFPAARPRVMTVQRFASGGLLASSRCVPPCLVLLSRAEPCPRNCDTGPAGISRTRHRARRHDREWSGCSHRNPARGQSLAEGSQVGHVPPVIIDPQGHVTFLACPPEPRSADLPPTKRPGIAPGRALVGPLISVSDGALGPPLPRPLPGCAYTGWQTRARSDRLTAGGTRRLVLGPSRPPPALTPAVGQDRGLGRAMSRDTSSWSSGLREVSGSRSQVSSRERSGPSSVRRRRSRRSSMASRRVSTKPSV